MGSSCSWQWRSSHSKAVAGQEGEGCLSTSVQGCYVLGKVQDLMKQDFPRATETHGRKALSAAQSIQETGPGGRHSTSSILVFCCRFVHSKDGESAEKSRESHVWPR